MTQALLKVDDLKKSYGAIQAVDGSCNHPTLYFGIVNKIIYIIFL